MVGLGGPISRTGGQIKYGMVEARLGERHGRQGDMHHGVTVTMVIHALLVLIVGTAGMITHHHMMLMIRTLLEQTV